MSQLVVFLYGANVAAHYNAVKVDAAAVVPLDELRAPLVEVTAIVGTKSGRWRLLSLLLRHYWFNGLRDCLIEGCFQLVNTAAAKQGVSFMCVFVHISNHYECKTSVLFWYFIC